MEENTKKYSKASVCSFIETDDKPVLLDHLVGKPISSAPAQLAPKRCDLSGPKLVLNFKANIEPGLRFGTDALNGQSKPDCITLKPKLKYRVISRFGRANGEGGRGSRREVSFVDDRPINHVETG